MFGVSSDDQESHAHFAKKQGLPFSLLVDEGGSLKRQWKVKKRFGFLSGRATFVIDKNCVLQHVYSSSLQPQKHAHVALRIIKGLSSP